MLTASSSRIIDDFKSGENVTLRLQKQLSTENRVSRAEKLQLATTILDHITSTDVPNHHETFLGALRFLRSLVPYMSVKSKSLMDTVASVERYSVNYGLRLRATNPKEKVRVDFLHESLRTIFEARKKSKCRPRTKPNRTRNASARCEKENVDPEVNVETEPEKLISVFLSAANDTLSLEDMRPDSDSPLVASTIAGALTTLFTANEERFDLSQLLSLANGIIMPWIEYMYCFDASLRSTACAYASRINHFLLVQCQTTKSNPFDVFEVRSFAIKIGEVKLNKYAKELLQSANFLLRNKALSLRERKVASQLVFKAYEDALQFISVFDAEDPKWFYEDVSAWIDNVFLLWSRKKLFPRIPKLLQRRKSIECQTRHHSFLSLCFSLQESLYKTGALCEEKALTYEGKIQHLSTPIWDKVDKVLSSTEFQDLTHETVNKRQSHGLATEGSKPEHVGLESLRLLRILEPLRQMIVAVPKEQDGLHTGAEKVLRIFLSTTLRGLYSVSREISSKETHDLHEELEVRLQKMVGGAIQASRNLLRHYWSSYDPQSFGAVFKQTFHIVSQHRRFCEDSARRWQSWVFVPILSKFENELASSNETNIDGSTDSLERVAVMAEVCLTSPSELPEHEVVPKELSSLFEIARETYACLRQWSKMTLVSLNWLSLHSTLCRNKVCEPQAKLAARTFVEDAANSILKGSALPELDYVDVESDIVVAILHEYLWLTYFNVNEFKSVYKLDQLRCGIQLARWTYLRQYSAIDKPCAIDQLHFQWLLYACEESECRRKELTRNASGRSKCKGHKRSGFFSVLGRESPCTPAHFSFAKELRLCWNASKANKFSDAGKSLRKMLTLVSSNPEIMDSLDLKIASIDILEWIGVKLTLHSYGVFAKQVGELLSLCRPKDGAPSLRFFETPPESPFLEVSRLLKEEQATTTWSYSTRYIRSDTCSVGVVCQARRAMQCLKSVILHLEAGRKRKNLIPKEEVSCEMAGVVVDIGFAVKNEIGKRSFSRIFLLIHHLIGLAIILLSMENMGDSKYYIERSMHVANQCLPPRSFLLKAINIIHNTICIPEASRRNEITGNLTSMAIEAFASIEDGTDTGALASMITELCWSLLDTRISRFHEQVGKELGLPVIDTVKQCKAFVSDARDSSMISDVELRMLTGMAYTVLGDYERALPFIEPLTNHDINSQSALTMFSIFCVVWCNLKCSNQVETCPSLVQREQTCCSSDKKPEQKS
ncbi:hypothetical protein FGB62_32g154 [Gracilaria domingensis]|nr:hypothetical protein FGB62_32g154 [Gracilaria domingensis]